MAGKTNGLPIHKSCVTRARATVAAASLLGPSVDEFSFRRMHRAFASFASASPRHDAMRPRRFSGKARVRVTPEPPRPDARRREVTTGATAEDGDGSVWLDVTALGRHRGARRANRGGESSSPMTRGATEATGTSARGAILGLLTTPRTRAGGRRARVKRSE